MSGHRCETCRDTGLVGRYASQWNDPQALEEGPCPEPDCAEGEFERTGVRPQSRFEAEAERDVKAAIQNHRFVADALARMFAPKEPA